MNDQICCNLLLRKKTFFVIDLFPEKNPINFEWKVAAAEISKIAKLKLLND